MGRLRYTLTNIWFYISMALVCFFLENVAFLSDNPMGGLSFQSLMFMGGAILITLGFYLIKEHVANKMKADWVLLPAFIILFAISLVAIWTNPESYEFYNSEADVTSIVTLSVQNKIVYSFQALVVFLSIYCICFVFSRFKVKTGKLLWIAIIAMIVIFGLCVYSFFKDRNIIDCIKTGSVSAITRGARSIFYNENNFALILLIGILCAFIVKYHKKKWGWLWAVIAVFAGFLVLTTSTLNIIVCGVAILLFAIVEIIYNFKNKLYIRATIGTSLLLFVFAGASIGISVCVANKVQIVETILRLFQQTIFDKDVGTFSNRTNIWKGVIELVRDNPLRLWFGYGHGASKAVLNGWGTSMIDRPDLRSCHSGLLELLLSGGIVTVALYSLVILYFFYCAIRLFIRKERHFVCVYGLCAICMLLHDSFESTHMLEMSTLGMIVTVLFFMPILIEWKQVKHGTVKRDLETFYVIPTQGVPSRNFISMLCTVLVSIIIPLCSSMIIPSFWSNLTYVKTIVLAICFLIVTLIFGPYLVFLWYRKSTNPRFIFRIILNSIWIIGIPFIASYFLRKIWDWNAFLVVGLTSYTALLALACLFYSLALKGNIKLWFKETVQGIFVTPVFAAILTLILTLMGFALTIAFVKVGYLEILIMAYLSFVLFWIIFSIIPSKKKDEMLKDFNEEGILTLKRSFWEETL